MINGTMYIPILRWRWSCKGVHNIPNCNESLFKTNRKAQLFSSRRDSNHQTFLQNFEVCKQILLFQRVNQGNTVLHDTVLHRIRATCNTDCTEFGQHATQCCTELEQHTTLCCKKFGQHATQCCTKV